MKLYFSVYSHFFIVPLAYLKILIFLKRHNKKIGGRSYYKIFLWNLTLDPRNDNKQKLWKKETKEYCFHRFELKKKIVERILSL